MTACKVPVCLQVMDGYSDHESEGNKKEWYSTCNQCTYFLKGILFVYISTLLLWNVIHVISADLDKKDLNQGPRNEK